MTRNLKPRAANPSAVPWRRARQITQIAALLIFLALLLVTRGGQFPSLGHAAATPVFFRLDPLAMLASIIAGRRWVEGLALAFVTLGVTVVLGRVWCGWICPLGTTLDWIGPRRQKAKRTAEPSERWRLVKVVVLIAILGAALAGNMTLMAFDPISLLTRGVASFLLPGLNQVLVGAEKLLYNVGVLQGALDWFESAVRTSLVPADVWRGWNLVPGLLLIGVIALNWVAARFWCRYLCPLGGLLGLVSRVALVRRVVGQEACRHCERCSRACPTGTIQLESFESDPAECTVCLDCLPECPTPGGQTFAPSWGRPRGASLLAPAQPYDPGRRQVLAALGGGLVAAAVYPLAPKVIRRDQRLIRPPGAQSEAFLSQCIRCGECLKVCPTSGLQPALWESGLDGFWTPTLVPRLGYCDYSCHACGQVCPTGALPNLSLEDKRKQVIGKAQIDRDICLPWAKNTPCIVCEEMCPLAPKAVELDTFYITDEAGQMVMLPRPHVLEDRCIGCGICEFKCPVKGAAAIRVGNA